MSAGAVKPEASMPEARRRAANPPEHQMPSVESNGKVSSPWWWETATPAALKSAAIQAAEVTTWSIR